MEVPHKNFYDFFEIKPSSRSKEILNAYKNKISKFRNIANLNSEQISEIKFLKQCLYILLNKNLRLKYNNIIGIKSNKNNFKNEPLAMNYENNDSLDNVFNVDNSWMNNHPSKNDKDKKDKNDSHLLGDRIFSLSNLQKKPGYSTDNEIDLRIPLQGRIDKNIEKL